MYLTQHRNGWIWHPFGGLYVSKTHVSSTKPTVLERMIRTTHSLKTEKPLIPLILTEDIWKGTQEEQKVER